MYNKNSTGEVPQYYYLYDYYIKYLFLIHIIYCIFLPSILFQSAMTQTTYIIIVTISTTWLHHANNNIASIIKFKLKFYNIVYAFHFNLKSKVKQAWCCSSTNVWKIRCQFFFFHYTSIPLLFPSSPILLQKLTTIIYQLSFIILICLNGTSSIKTGKRLINW